MDINQESWVMASRLRRYANPFLYKNVLIDWTVTVHEKVVYFWNKDGTMIAQVTEAHGVYCEMCDPIHVHDALKELTEPLP
ncbi:hypothetical protein [Pseudomonas phage D6]|nr:hypothetical protein [Pseudomonas phage D6]